MSKMAGFLAGMSYILIYPFILILLLFNPGFKMDQVVFLTDDSNITVNVEVADTAIKHQIGLMNRTHLPYKSGMLFVFSDERPRTFWMKNTPMPLDMIFIGRDMRVVNITKNAQPCKTITCELYSSGVPAQYVVEVNAGFADKEGIKVGDSVKVSSA
jgi:uncharacterized membrane protein (UPF0127 family)